MIALIAELAAPRRASDWPRKMSEKDVRGSSFSHHCFTGGHLLFYRSQPRAGMATSQSMRRELLSGERASRDRYVSRGPERLLEAASIDSADFACSI